MCRFQDQAKAAARNPGPMLGSKPRKTKLVEGEKSCLRAVCGRDSEFHGTRRGCCMSHRLTVSSRPGLDATCVPARTLGAATTHQPSRAQPQRRAFQNATGPMGNGPRTASLAFLRHTTGFRISCSDLFGGVCCRACPGRAAGDRVTGQG